MGQPLATALDTHLRERAPFGLLLAVSGGPDSRALLEAVARWPGRFLGPIHVASVDHATRSSSTAESAAVVARASALGFDGAVLRLRLGLRGAPNDSESSARDEATLRRARYEALVTRAQLLGLGAVVVAHHEGDVAEGALMSWLGHGGEGASMRAVARVTDVDVDVVRPFLALSRAALRVALVAFGATDAVVDPERASLRARLREGELTALGAGRSAVEGSLARAARRRGDDEGVLAVAAEALLEAPAEGVRVRPGPAALVRRALRLALARVAPALDVRDSSRALDSVLELMQRGRVGEVHLRGGLAKVGPEGALISAASGAAPRTVAVGAAPTHDVATASETNLSGTHPLVTVKRTL